MSNSEVELYACGSWDGGMMHFEGVIHCKSRTDKAEWLGMSLRGDTGLWSCVCAVFRALDFKTGCWGDDEEFRA